MLIEGPRACGKTELARRQVASEVLLDIDENARRAMAIDPALMLAGDTPRLIDEWQVEPGIWNHVRRAVDRRGSRGQFVLTGSSVPADDVTRHTGAGVAFLRVPDVFFAAVCSVSASAVRASGRCRTKANTPPTPCT